MSGTNLATNGTPQNLNQKQMRAISALLVSGNREQAARDAGVSKTSIYRWFQEPTFVAALHAAEQDALADVSRQLVSLSRLAADTLAAAMRDPLVSTSNRLRAAEAVLNQLLKLRELIDLESRLTDLEERMNDDRT